jgi:hypothetical protein
LSLQPPKAFFVATAHSVLALALHSRAETLWWLLRSWGNKHYISQSAAHAQHPARNILNAPSQQSIRLRQCPCLSPSSSPVVIQPCCELWVAYVPVPGKSHRSDSL